MGRTAGAAAKQASAADGSSVQAGQPQVVCKFEELKGEFLVKREIGRGKYY